MSDVAADLEEQREEPQVMPPTSSSRLVQYFPLCRTLVPIFGGRCVTAIAIVYVGAKGFIYQLLGLVELPMYKDVFHVNGSTRQRLSNVSTLAWAMKPAIGIVSDSFAIRGYHKRTYMFLAALAIIVLVPYVAILPATESSAFYACMGFFGLNFCVALLDLLTEATYSALMLSAPSAGSALVTWVWGWAMVGSAIAAVVSGPLSDMNQPRLALLFCMPIALALVVPLWKNWLGEARVRRHAISDAANPNDDEGDDSSARPMAASFFLRHLSPSVQQHPKIALYSLAMFIGAVVMMFTSASITATSQFVIVAAVTLTLNILNFKCLPKTIAMANTFMFLKEALYIQIGGALDYYYTEGPPCVVDGPQFSYTFYNATTAVVGAVAGAVGVSLFHLVFSERSLRITFWCTTVLKIISSIFDLAIVLRWNRQYLGIDDRSTYFLGDAVISNVCYMLDFMPAVILISRLCPRGLESTMYAVLAGFSNMGQNLSRSMGVLLMDYYRIQTPPQECNFTQLPLLIFVCHFVSPAFVIALVFWLIPNKKVSDVLLPEGLMTVVYDVVPAEEDMKNPPSAADVK